ncbi:GNAT family N-acetyltransferase [Jidongwangia harbinensis]|uniref:GNAT family N-acetyltransferase n=1 Tax=Jidongwangia harbinensis TaxID=2878561 RepID=UPI001CD9F54B|nr:GNAT family N-acetyltransferase [Jidongwangia harbinensis]MCA2215042.1 GNAT family N-acetyltransferase [Jidongwangia harbinensis]
MPAPLIRPATGADAPQIATVWYAGWRDGHLGHVPDALVAVRTPESFRTRAADRVADTTVAVDADGVAGFVMVAGDEVEQVYVAADRRGTGLAGALLAEAERRVAAGGHGRAWLAVAAGNERARRFYARSGWVDDGPFTYAAAGPDGTIDVPVRRYVKSPLTGTPTTGPR